MHHLWHKACNMSHKSNIYMSFNAFSQTCEHVICSSVGSHCEEVANFDLSTQLKGSFVWLVYSTGMVMEQKCQQWWTCKKHADERHKIYPSWCDLHRDFMRRTAVQILHAHCIEECTSIGVVFFYNHRLITMMCLTQWTHLAVVESRDLYSMNPSFFHVIRLIMWKPHVRVYLKFHSRSAVANVIWNLLYPINQSSVCGTLLLGS